MLNVHILFLLYTIEKYTIFQFVYCVLHRMKNLNINGKFILRQNP